MRGDAQCPSLMEDRRLFRFAPSLHQDFSDFFNEFGRADTSDDRLGSIFRELAYLTAAEYALHPVITDPRPTLPVPDPFAVEQVHGRLSLAKTNCMIFCPGLITERGFGLSDVTAFSGDVSKLKAVGLETESLEYSIPDMASAVGTLETWHRESPIQLGLGIADSGVLRLQGFLWAVKLSLPWQPVAEAVNASFQAFRLMHPAGGPEVGA